MIRSQAFVKGGIDRVKVFGIQIVLRNTQGIGEALVMNNLSFPQKFDGIPYVGVVGEAENVVVGGASLLLC